LTYLKKTKNLIGIKVDFWPIAAKIHSHTIITKFVEDVKDIHNYTISLVKIF